MVWGWRVISPDAPFTEGLPYNTPKYDKVVVLMTDGVNGYYRLSGSDFDSDFSAYRRVDDGVFGTTSKNTAKNRMNQRLRSEEHTSELQSLMRISYAVFCLKKKNKYQHSKISYNSQ